MSNPPAHRSFSQLATFNRCQQQYYLAKIVQVPEVPAVYLAAGSAVHTAIEHLNHLFYRSMQDGSQA